MWTSSHMSGINKLKTVVWIFEGLSGITWSVILDCSELKCSMICLQHLIQLNPTVIVNDISSWNHSFFVKKCQKQKVTFIIISWMHLFAMFFLLYAFLQSGKRTPSSTSLAVLFDVWLSKRKYQYSGLLAILQRMALRHESEGQPLT